MQRALDTTLAKADEAVRERFALAMADGRRARPPSPSAEGDGGPVGPTAGTLAGAGAGVSGHHRAVLRAVFGIDGDELGEDGGETMERRMFMLLQAAVLAGLGAGGTAAVLEAVRHELDRSVADGRGTEGVDE